MLPSWLPAVETLIQLFTIKAPLISAVLFFAADLEIGIGGCKCGFHSPVTPGFPGHSGNRKMSLAPTLRHPLVTFSLILLFAVTALPGADALRPGYWAMSWAATLYYTWSNIPTARRYRLRKILSVAALVFNIEQPHIDVWPGQGPDARIGEAASGTVHDLVPTCLVRAREVERATLCRSRRIGMSTNQRTPASIAGIKRLAKKIASEKSVTHTVALEEASKLAGYQNFIHAKRALSAEASRPKHEPPRVSNARKPEMNTTDFHTRARSNWTATVNQFAAGNQSVSWSNITDIVRVLQPFMGSNANHAHLPTGGGFDFKSVALSKERGCIDFQVGSRLNVTVKPKLLRIERIEADPAESFLFLELDDLNPSGAYGEDGDASVREQRQEEVVDIGDGTYVTRNGVDDGYYVDEHGSNHDLPDDYRQIMRFLDGNIMIVCKGSIWNGSPGTYQGTHDKMSAGSIRGLIERTIAKRVAA